LTADRPLILSAFQQVARQERLLKNAIVVCVEAAKPTKR
jgi:hypothetical protein